MDMFSSDGEYLGSITNEDAGDWCSPIHIYSSMVSMHECRQFKQVCPSLFINNLGSLRESLQLSFIGRSPDRKESFQSLHRRPSIGSKGGHFEWSFLGGVPRPRRRRSSRSSSAVNSVKSHLFGTCKFDDNYNESLTFRSLITSIQPFRNIAYH